MNAEQFKGTWTQFKGEVKRQWGRLTDDDMTEAAGNYDKFVGRVQERYGDKKEDVLKWTNEWFDRQKTQSGSQR
ncbi:CsbD family protein [Candidatus Nitrospira nitrificans]|jgi:uncharacterized protein YjbJ (UPF0337 family)|uniref:CsbD-like domain-containing protein n=1 Tax=Candidatus Nitrospira nitrificans TaxID=1742973 RepID=A0A0S4LUT8_9BACT|nr:CsbD family protein [Candidatus Nitrospira nitrificans]CUS39739.1 conserved hypothetical protein [Candidatus Nitrospira nitrificans]